jgi:putative drug exporter of the RND superfamily
MSRLLYALGGLCVRRRWPVFVAWIAVVVVIVLITNAVGKQTSQNLTLPGSGSTQAQDLLQNDLPKYANGTNPVVMEPPHGKLTSAANAKVVKRTVQSLEAAPHVISAVSPLSTEGASALSKNERIGYIAVALNVSSGDITDDEANDVIDAEAPAVKAGFDVATGGYVGNQVSSPAVEKSEAVGLAAAVVILLFTFGTAVAMILPIFTSLLGLAVGLSAIGLLGHAVDVPTVGPTLGTMLGLGVGIDYALFIVTRHRGFMEQGHGYEEAAARSVATAGGAVVFAGGTVVIALLSLVVANIPIVSALGYSAALVVVIAVLTAVTLLPAILAILGDRINSLRVPFVRPPAHDHRPHGWARWARFIGRYALPAMVMAVALLLVLAAPVRNLVLGQQDNGELPKDTTSRQAYDLLSEGFGPGVNGPFLIAVDFGKDPAHPDSKKLHHVQQQQQQAEQQAKQQQEKAAQKQEQQAIAQQTAQLEAQGVPPSTAQQEATQAVQSQAAKQPPPQPTAKQQKQQQQVNEEEKFLKTPASDPRLVTLENKIAKTKGVKEVSQAQVDNSGGAAVFNVIATTAPSANRTADLVGTLRDPVIPDATKGTTLAAYVGGQTAGYVDLASRISDKLPLVIIVVIGLSFILLTLAFHTVVVPLTSGLMNLLSVAAAYGVLTFVFQEGHGAKLIGLPGPTPIVSYVPLLMFAILFGLSMDYQVFLLSRIQEHYRESGDNHEAVVDGLAVSARVITAAALIMVSVYTSFVLNGNPVVKEFGFGLAIAVAVDATIVRCILVPSVMVLLGKANWWMPRFLRRLPRVGIEGEDFFRAQDEAAAKAPATAG